MTFLEAGAIDASAVSDRKLRSAVQEVAKYQPS